MFFCLFSVLSQNFNIPFGNLKFVVFLTYSFFVLQRHVFVSLVCFDFDLVSVHSSWYPMGGGGGEGGTLIFSSYVGSGPASTVHPKKIWNFKHPKIIFEILPCTKKISPIPHSVPWP